MAAIERKEMLHSALHGATVAVALGLALLACGAGQQSLPQATGSTTFEGVDPEVVFVNAGGYWTRGSSAGRYRIVVRNNCSAEHCYANVTLQRIQESTLERPSVEGSREVDIPVGSTVRQVKFWPSGKWAGEIQLELVDAEGAPNAICIHVTDDGASHDVPGFCENER
jgi:hypothetical protein